jgi:hypothetical protein
MSAQRAGVDLPDVTEPIVDLFAAQTCATMSWIHYLLAPQLAAASPLIPARIRHEVRRRVLSPAFERDDFWWMWKGDAGTGHRLNNWNPWINSNLLLGNLLLETDADRRLKAIAKICKSVDAFLKDYSDDAACEEGPGYWGESAAAYFDVCTLLQSAVPGTPGVLKDPFVRRMMHYIADVHIAGRFSVNFGDASALAGSPGALGYVIGQAVGDPQLQQFGAFTLPPVSSDDPAAHGKATPADSLTHRGLLALFGTTRARQSVKTDALGRDSWFPALCLMTARQREGSADGFYLAAQAARNQRSHGHNDSGSFIVFHDGAPVFVDAGTQAYTKQTFGPDRYKIWIMQSAFHNLPTIGGVMQSADDAKYRAGEAKYFCSDDRSGLTLNLATAYPDEAGLERWMRTVRLDRKVGRVLINEDFTLGKPAPVVLNFLTPRTPASDKDGLLVLTTANQSSKAVTLKFDPAQLTASFAPIELTDAGLKSTWGQLFRIQLTTPAPVGSGRWAFEII